MLTNIIRRWLGFKWQPLVDPKIASHYQATFQTPSGQYVLQHLMDTVYCTVYEGDNPALAMAHNARRSVIHDILVNLDMAEFPRKYQENVKQGQEATDGRVDR